MFFAVIGACLLVVALISLPLSKQRPRVKALWVYWACLMLELAWVVDSPHDIAAVVVTGVTVVAGAVTIFVLPGESQN